MSHQKRTSWIIVGFIIFSAAAQGQTSNDWDAVRALATGTSISIENRARGTIDGTLETVQDGELTISVKGRSYAIQRVAIRKIERFGDRAAGKKVRRYAAIGAVAGVLQGYTLAKGSKTDMALLLGMDWAAMGALIGAIDGSVHRQRILVYRARP